MYAIIKTGGKQYKAEEGQIIKVEKLEAAEGETVEFDQVLAITGEETKFGHPFIENAKVTGKVIEQGKNKKVIVYKFRPKNHYRKKMGHRQPYTRVLIEKVEG